MIGPFVFAGRLTRAICSQFLQNELSGPTATQTLVHFEHDGAPPNFSREVETYLGDLYRLGRALLATRFHTGS